MRWDGGVTAAEDLIPERRTFKVWLRDYLNKRIDKEKAKKNKINISGAAAGGYYPGQHKFNKDFEGWNIRLHRAVDGHIVEAWKSYSDHHPRQHNHKPDHELFMVGDDKEMSEALNNILIQLMLRG